MSRRTQIVVGFVISAVLLVWFFRQADLGRVVEHVRGADYRLVGVALALSVAAMLLRAWRWGYLVRPLADVAYGTLVHCTMIGWAVTALVPGRLGEIVRPILLARRAEVGKSAAFATVVLERVFDLVAVLGLLAGYLLLFPMPPALDREGVVVIRTLRLTGILALGAIVGGFCVLAALERWPRRSERVVQRLLGLLPRGLGEKSYGILRAFLSGFASLRSPRLLVVIALQTAVLWGGTVVQYVVLFDAFSIDVPYWAGLPLVVLVVIGVIVPTPAGMGSFHAAVQVGLVTLWGVANDVVVSYAIVTHAVAFVPVTVIGVSLMAREGLSLAAVRQMGEERPAPP